MRSRGFGVSGLATPATGLNPAGYEGWGIFGMRLCAGAAAAPVAVVAVAYDLPVAVVVVGVAVVVWGSGGFVLKH